MKKVFLKELRMNVKVLLIWGLAVGGLGMACILLYDSMQGDMKQMADAFSNMGAFSDAFGMSTLSIATLKGYFATEVGTVHGLGSGMFAAILAIGILSREEEGHTGEFLLSLPITRSKTVAVKGAVVVFLLFLFTVFCGIFYAAGSAILGEQLPAREFLVFMSRQLLMNLEIAGICFAISSLSGKNRTGAGIGITLLFYIFDLTGRVVPDLKDYLYLGPYSYANASEIFSGAGTPANALIIAIAVMICGAAFAFFCYNRRDLAA